jgi:hypothetical protein
VPGKDGRRVRPGRTTVLAETRRPVDGVTFHQDTFGRFGQGAARERPPTSRYSANRRSEVGVGDVGEHASFGCLPDEVRVSRVDQDDYGADDFADDLVDQIQRTLRALAQSKSATSNRLKPILSPTR